MKTNLSEVRLIQILRTLTAINLAFQTEQHFFDYIYEPENSSRLGDRFGCAKAAAAAKFLDGTLDLYDWTQFRKGDKIVDVGGGIGHIGTAIAKRVQPGVE